MAKNTCCSRTHKTPSQLESSDCRHRPTVILRIFFRIRKKKEFINSAPICFYSPLNLFTHATYMTRIFADWNAYPNYYYSCILSYYSSSFARIVPYDFGFCIWFSFLFTRGIFFCIIGYLRLKYIHGIYINAKIMLYLTLYQTSAAYLRISLSLHI